MNNEGHICCLHEDLLREILRRLTMGDAARTSCLSKAWKGYWDSLPYLNFDQRQFPGLLYTRFKDFVDHKLMKASVVEVHVLKFRLCMRLDDDTKKAFDLRRWVSLATKMNVKELDLEIIRTGFTPSIELPDDLYNAEKVIILKISGFQLPQFSENMKFSHLQNLCLENVVIMGQSVIGQFFTSCPLIRGLRLVECKRLKQLEVSDLRHLKSLEVGFCPELQSIEIQVPGLEKLILSEIHRDRADPFRLALNITSETCESLTELTIRNSTLSSKAFATMFSGCSNVESLVLDGCTTRFFRISISNQKLRRLVLRRCHHLFFADIKAPNLTSLKFFTNYLPFYYVETSHLQQYMLDFSKRHVSYGSGTDLGLSFWFDNFKETVTKSHKAEGPKMVIYPSFHSNIEVVVLEGWSSMTEHPFMRKTIRAAASILITNMPFSDLTYNLFSGIDFKHSQKVLAISSTDESKLYEALKKKANYSCQQCLSVVLAKTEMGTYFFNADWQSFSAESSSNDKYGIFSEALLEAGMTTTLKATLLSISSPDLKMEQM